MPFATFRLWGKIFWITLSLLRKIVVVGRAIVPVWSVRPILCFNDWTLLSMISSNWYITKVVIDLITVWKPSCLIYRKLSVWIQTLSVLAPIQYFHSLVRFNIHIAVSWFRLYLISWLQSTFHSITNNFDLCWIERFCRCFIPRIYTVEFKAFSLSTLQLTVHVDHLNTL